MRDYLRFVLLLIACSATLPAGPPKTTPTPVQVAISPTYSFGGVSLASAVFPDSAAAYIDGAGGVSAFLNASTGDLILDLNNSTRHAGFSFQNAVATNPNTPSWSPVSFLAAGSRFVVGNLMYQYSANAYYQFTTIANFQFTPPDGRSNQYKDQDQICFANPGAQLYKGCGDNNPNPTAIVVVTHTPADTLTGAAETWTIVPDNAISQVGTLLVPDRSRLVNAGQFSLPFQFIVTRK